MSAMLSRDVDPPSFTMNNAQMTFWHSDMSHNNPFLEESKIEAKSKYSKDLTSLAVWLTTATPRRISPEWKQVEAT